MDAQGNYERLLRQEQDRHERLLESWDKPTQNDVNEKLFEVIQVVEKNFTDEMEEQKGINKRLVNAINKLTVAINKINSTVPYSGGEKRKLSDKEILHRTKLHNEIKERTAQRLNKGG